MKIYVILCFFVYVNAKPWQNSNRAVNCGYDTCTKTSQDHLNVHVVPHSHDDVGWLKTIDQYFYGSRTDIQRAGVNYIIDSVVRALSDNPERRFIQVETLFFHEWYKRQSNKKKQEVADLVNEGRLEFIGGGWSMNDEAATHYQSIIDQFTLGLRFLNDTFGECGRPKIGWQIDPFGHSKEMANIIKHMGYDALFFARLDWRDKERRMETKTSEMIWQSSSNLGDDSNLFTSVLYNHYSAPHGYCFDILCSYDPIIEEGPEYNYEEKVKGYADFIKEQAPNYPTNNIIITMGDDFNFQDALQYFYNLDKLIDGFELFPQMYEGKRIKVFYSTPSCYIKAVNDAAFDNDQAFAVKTDDFFPYASDYHAYWTGYFTSRPTSKRFERQLDNFLQGLKQVKAQTKNDNGADFEILENAVGLMQHHDAITGTEKQHVADDYARIMTEEVESATLEINTLISNLLAKTKGGDLELNNCLLANISICSFSSGDQFTVAVYNSLSRPVDHIVRLPVDGLSYTVVDHAFEVVKSQVTPSIANFTLMENHAKYDLVFLAKEIPPLGINLYFVSAETLKEYRSELVEDLSSERYDLGNDNLGISIDENTGLLQRVTISGIEYNVRQELMYYIGAKGNNSAFEHRASGAYIFRPKPEKGEAIPFTEDKITTKTYKGDVVEEVHQYFSSWATQVIRVYPDKNHIEFDWLIGPIPIDDNEGREVISRFTTDFNSDDVFYTDSNGREMVKRIRNHRATYNYTNEEPVAGNYYPITSKISIKDEARGIQLSVMNDRAQGGSSLKSGELELMLHRRLLNDDAFGVGEALNEKEFGQGMLARGTHYLRITETVLDSESVEIEKDVGEEAIRTPWTLVSKITATTSIEDLFEKFAFTHTSLQNSLPKNVKILSLDNHRRNSKNSVLLRLEHIYEKGEHPTLSKDVTVDISNLFNAFTVKSLRETTLDGNMWLDEVEEFTWIKGGNLEDVNYQEQFDYDGKPVINRKIPQGKDDFSITLSPMQIRTFVLEVNYNTRM